MEDIEDLVQDDGEVLVPRHRNSVMPRVRHRKKVSHQEAEVCQNGNTSNCGSVIPGTQKNILEDVGLRAQQLRQRIYGRAIGCLWIPNNRRKIGS